MKAVVLLIGAAVAALPFHVHARAVATPFVVTVGIGPPRFNVELWVVRGRISKRVVATRQRAIRDPSWSLRGRRLAFTVVRDPLLDRGMHVFVANADGTHKRRLTRSSNRVDEFTPAWSPGGRTIAFARSRKGVAPAIWLARSDGRSLRQLTSGWSPAWAPDGARLVFTDRGVLWTIRRDGSARVQLTQPPTDPSCDFASGEDYDGSPDWSPQGDAIAFVRYCGSPDHTDEDAIYVIRSDGTGLHALTHGPLDDSPSWAPDGRTLAFVRAGRAESVPAAGGPPKTLYSPRKRQVYDVAWRR